MLNQNCLLPINGMNCSACVSTVKSALSNVYGVEIVTINFTENVAVVAGDVPVDALLKVIKDAGYIASELNLTEE